MGIEGKWVNELGSEMSLQLAQDGAISGTYLSSKAGNDENTEPLAGYSRAGATGILLGWAVCYSSTEDPDEEPTVCAWSGRYTNVDGVETIDTTWLLTQVTREQGNWDSTMVGKNTFKRA